MRTNRTTATARIGIAAATTALLVGLSLPAFAHVGLEPAEVPAESGTTLSFRIGHGCDASPTTGVAIQIPAGVASVKPFPKAGWALDVTTGSLPEAITTSSGDTITEGVTVVTWSDGSLDDAHTDVFEIRATLYGTAGSAIYFPVVQTCESGEHAWIQIPSEGQGHGDLEEPAPGVVLAERDAGGHAAEADDPDASAQPLTLVALVVGLFGLALGASAFIRSTRRR